MQQIKVRYENGVFMPLEHIEPELYRDAIVTVKAIKTEKKAISGEKAVATDEYRARAKAYIEKNFPDVEVSQNVMSLTGILRDVQCDDCIGVGNGTDALFVALSGYKYGGPAGL